MLRLGWMREQLGYVSGEMLLHGYSIADNIAYGNNMRDVSRAEVVSAAQEVDAHDFITQLPQVGFNHCFIQIAKGVPLRTWLLEALCYG